MNTEKKTAGQVRTLDPVDFHGQALVVVDKDGEPYVAMKPVVEGMGLAWPPQYRKLTEEGSKFCGVIISMQLPGETQVREVTAIPLRKLTWWLMTLQPSRMDIFIADKVRIYQNECDDALWAYWRKAMREPQVMDSTKSTDLQPFSFENHPVRIVLDEKGEPWWAAKDVAVALGYAPSSDINSLVSKVPDKWLCPKPFGTNAGMREMIALSENGLYIFVLRSNMPAALPFQEWIAGEVLPSIRRTGQYSAIPEDPTQMGLPDFNDPIAAAEGWLAEAKKRREAEAVARVAKDLARVAMERTRLLTAKVEDDAPKVDFADRLQAAPTTHLVGAVAKMIQQGTKISMGQNRMFEWLRENKYLHQTGSRRNHPTQRSLDAGWFTLQVRNVEVNSETKVKYTTRVTGKGLLHLYEHFYAMAVESGLKPDPTPPMVTSADILRQLPIWEHEDRDGVDEQMVAEARRMDRKGEN